MPKSFFASWLCFLLLQTITAQQNATLETSVNKVKFSFALDAKGMPSYQVSYDNKAVILPSHLGFVLSNDSTCYKDFELIGSEKRSFDETWQPVWGEVKDIRNHYEELTVRLKQKTSGHFLNIIFRVFDDGVGFRYEFPKQSNLTYFFIVQDELTEFHLAGDHKTFWIPGDYDTNEYPYGEQTQRNRQYRTRKEFCGNSCSCCPRPLCRTDPIDDEKRRWFIY